jgi:hypothetical protein
MIMSLAATTHFFAACVHEHQNVKHTADMNCSHDTTSPFHVTRHKATRYLFRNRLIERKL